LNFDSETIKKITAEAEREYQENLEMTLYILDERFPSLTNHPLFCIVARPLAKYMPEKVRSIRMFESMCDRPHELDALMNTLREAVTANDALKILEEKYDKSQ